VPPSAYSITSKYFLVLSPKFSLVEEKLFRFYK